MPIPGISQLFPIVLKNNGDSKNVKLINGITMDATIIIVLVCLAACVAVYPKFEKRFGEMK